MKEAELSERMADYFSGRKEYVPGLPSYDELQGVSIWVENPNDPNDPEYPIFDKYPEAKAETEGKIKEALGVLYNARAEDIDVLARFEVNSGKTTPIKVEALFYEAVPRVTYVKQIDWKRFFGLEFYNMLSGRKPLDFIFSDAVHIEAKAKGKVKLHKSREVDLERNETYLRNLIRLDVLADALSLHDLGNPWNTHIDRDFGIHLFDFDEAFCRRTYDLWSGTAAEGLPVREIIEDEQNLIARRAAKEADRVTQLIAIMKDADFRSEEAYRLGCGNMGEYVEERLNAFGWGEVA